ncbi:hypothetical protein M011DRAFT_170478 [Sporormia fimetaria CBS 119925]|uniref:Uncharacterized protein n=1 Tax=Sporormia fimetaria CBS 119925 TaxID=1340428 RepID=A0A6A6V380_9PLEO|nr:hypothetical protein M011DRAFT_170478 [Sporormia fimetaria CBS 119925]
MEMGDYGTDVEQDNWQNALQDPHPQTGIGNDREEPFNPIPQSSNPHSEQPHATTSIPIFDNDGQEPFVSIPQPNNPHVGAFREDVVYNEEGYPIVHIAEGKARDTSRGSKTVAWGRRGYSKFCINRMGLAAAGYYRIESQPIFEKDGEVDWQNPPDHLCVSNPENRIGEHKFGRSYRYTLKNMTGIYGVAFKAQAKKTFPEWEVSEEQDSELVN